MDLITQTFCRVVKHTSICLVLSLAMTWNWPNRQLDVQNAFLHGILNEDANYISRSMGLNKPSERGFNIFPHLLRILALICWLYRRSYPF